MKNNFSLRRLVAGAQSYCGFQFFSYWPRLVASLCWLVAVLAAPAAYALQGNDNCHDPSTIIKEGNKYWIFTTGTDIYAMYSTDLVNWQSGPKSVFNGVQPAWITGRVPGFDRTKDTYWAPECVYRNGKYYLYYSCSSFGSNTSAIGLVTNVTLDPSSPNYKWVDQGEVVSTNNSSPNNAIDPAVVTDANGGVWMSYGSFFQGIGLIKLDGTTGKRADSSFYWLTGNVDSNGNRNWIDTEASYLVRQGSYYYLFVNKGACCQGSSSTYYVQVGRASSITGPYLDRNGVDMNRGGGTTILATQGNYVGPGCVGLFVENGVNYFTHHYYDSNQNGRARLSVGNLGWDGAGWPFATRDWLAAGRYTLKNVNSNLVWDAWGCTGTQGQAIAQGNPANLSCQQWDLTPDNNGEYKITCALGGLAADVANNNPNNGAPLQLYPYNGGTNQRFKIERINATTYVLSSVNGNRVVEVPACSATAGSQLALYDYLGNNCQKWVISPAGSTNRTASTTQALAATATQDRAPTFSVYPNPAPQGRFTVDLGSERAGGPVDLRLTDALGRVVYTRSTSQPTVTLETDLHAGFYWLQVSGTTGTFSQRLVVN